MPQFNALQLENRVRAAADTHDNYVEKSMIWGWLDRERKILDMLIARKGLVQNRSIYDIPLTGDGSEYTLPTGMMAVLGVYEVDTASGQGTRFRRLRRASNVDPPRMYNSNKASSYSLYTDSAGDLNIELRPIPSGGTYRVYYLAEPAEITSDIDIITYPAGWEEFLVLGAAISALAREESTNPVIERQYREAGPRIEAEIAALETGESQVIRNVDGLYGSSEWSSYPTFDRSDISLV